MRAALAFYTCLLILAGPRYAFAQSVATPPPPLAGTPSPYESIDRHALTTPPQVELSLDTLAAYLVEPAQNDAEKARAIFRWMTDRIAFDTDAYITEHHGHLQPEMVLRNRRALCQGSSALFEALATRAGLECVTIAGYAKGAGFFDEEVDPPQTRFRPNHTWNAVKANGRWQLVDVTRGSGYIKAKRFRKQFQEQYFFTPPAHLVRTHLPSDPAWQLLPMPITLPQFDALPYIDAGYLRMGMKAGAFWHRPVPDTDLDAWAKAGWLKVLAAPSPQGPLQPGRDYYFLIDAPQAVEVAVSQGRDAYALKRVGTRFEGAVRPHPGEMKLSMRRQPQAPLESVLQYEVALWPGQRPAPQPTPERQTPAWLNFLKGNR